MLSAATALTVTGCFPADMSVDYGTDIGPGYISVGTTVPVAGFGPFYDTPTWGLGPNLWPVQPPAPRPVNVRPPMRPVPMPSPEPGPVIPPSGPSLNPGGGGSPGQSTAPRPSTGNQFRPGGIMPR